MSELHTPSAAVLLQSKRATLKKNTFGCARAKACPAAAMLMERSCKESANGVAHLLSACTHSLGCLRRKNESPNSRREAPASNERRWGPRGHTTRRRLASKIETGWEPPAKHGNSLVACGLAHTSRGDQWHQERPVPVKRRRFQMHIPLRDDGNDIPVQQLSAEHLRDLVAVSIRRVGGVLVAGLQQNVRVVGAHSTADPTEGHVT